MTPKDLVNHVSQKDIKFIDLRFTDTIGREHHISFPTSVLDEEKLLSGQPFDGSSIPGWKGIEASDMVLIPDLSTAKIDPFREEVTLMLVCDVIDPNSRENYNRDPRSIAKRAELYLHSSGIGDTAFFGPEPEFFIFDGITWKVCAEESFFKIRSEEGAWSSNKESFSGNLNSGYRSHTKGGYFPVPPVDSFQDIRSEICLVLEKLGIPVEVHHHEVASAGQVEIGTRFSSLLERADWCQLFKYVVRNVANRNGKTVTFMPKPVTGDNGSGMHLHQSIWKDGINLFSGDEYAGLSEFALYYIGGIIKHARALNAITNPSTNSYRRLVPHFEAPVKLAYSACNRSASIRIPYTNTEHGRRIEVRFPDPSANPYLAFSAMMLAGLDGVKNKIHPGPASEKNLYDLSKDEDSKIPCVCRSLYDALDALDKDRLFLTEGDVFSNDFIDSYIELKSVDIARLQSTVHPIEFDLYYTL